jgi:hypothetical protein
MKKLFGITVVAICLNLFSNARAVDFAIRLGQGGLSDDRAPDGALGGGQLALDIKLEELPIAISISQEYYKKSAEATHPYEINGMVVIYVLYVTPLTKKWKSDVYGGCGIGLLYVPKGEGDSDEMERGVVYDGALGINARVFKKMGLYAEGKYVYSSKTVNDVKVIDFSDFGLLLGISLNFAW